MLAVQLPMPLPRALPPRARRNRRAFQPGTPSQPYKLPHEVRDRLVAALQPFRNRDAAFALAVFLGRFWSMPGRVALPFVIDRVALADRPDLELTEARVRGAIKTLETIGFLDRWQVSGSRYRATEHGLRRKPVPFTFGSEFMTLFIAANRRSRKAREGVRAAHRPSIPDRPSRPSVSFPNVRALKSPERKSEAEPKVYLGENLPRLSEAALRIFGTKGLRRGGRGQ